MEKLTERVKKLVPEASGRTVKALIVHGRVLVDGEVASRPDITVAPTSRVTIAPKAAVDPDDDGVPMRVVFEDDALAIVDKPPGLITVSERTDGRPSAWSVFRERLKRRGERATPSLVHRLDAPASGLLVFAKSDAVGRALKDLFAAHLVDRHYAVVVAGEDPGAQGAFESDLVESDRPPHRVRSVRPTDPAEISSKGRTALTRWRKISSRGDRHAVETRLETGRKHQIRAHWSEAGRPIVGDELYGGPKASRLLLHAWRLGFRHPKTGERVDVTAPPGPSFDSAGKGAFSGAPTIRPLVADLEGGAR
jgi:23S rRNA pseudouridine1911/1915/1917 synthase